MLLQIIFQILLLASTMVSAKVRMIQNNDKMTCGLEGTVGFNGTWPANMVFATELEYQGSEGNDPKFCLNMCLSNMLDNWGQIMGGDLCCTYLAYESATVERHFCAMTYAG